METVWIMLASGAMCVVCFFLGAKVGQTVSRDEEIKVPTVNPMEVYREHEAKREARREQERNDAILRNIERYDGTGRGQEEVPGR